MSLVDPRNRHDHPRVIGNEGSVSGGDAELGALFRCADGDGSLDFGADAAVGQGCHGEKPRDEVLRVGLVAEGRGVGVVVLPAGKVSFTEVSVEVDRQVALIELDGAVLLQALGRRHVEVQPVGFLGEVDLAVEAAQRLGQAIDAWIVWVH